MDKPQSRFYSAVRGIVISSAIVTSSCFDFDSLSNGDLAANERIDSAMPILLPVTCAGRPDGRQTLFLASDQSRPWTARCDNGLTYLPFAHIATNDNFSQYKAGGYTPGQDVVTNYTAVRFDPVSLLVDVSDQTFSISNGTLRVTGINITSMPYAVAMDCVSKQTATGKANINLKDTAFAVQNNVFSAGGVQLAGTVILSSDGKVADLAGGGECGWTAAGKYSGAPVNRAGGFQLQLQYQP